MTGLYIAIHLTDAKCRQKVGILWAKRDLKWSKMQETTSSGQATPLIAYHSAVSDPLIGF